MSSAVVAVRARPNFDGAAVAMGHNMLFGHAAVHATVSTMAIMTHVQ